ncbi:MAG: TRAP transporter large permease [Alphaproteobacteria bacterium]|nr:TRAP transporter large permease [Alphaproteobacteria bacterium]
MSPAAAGFVIFGVLLALLLVRVPIGIAMFLVGAGGYLYFVGGEILPLMHSLKNLAYARLSNYDLVVIPIFLLMGQFATHGGLSRSLFNFVRAFMGHMRGGLAMASIGACAGFGAICGSSLATAATMGHVALPELRRHGYSGALATGTLAAGGTLGIMIPPSVPLVVYAILTHESIGKLFMAAVLPGLVAMVGYMMVVAIMVRINPNSGPAAARMPWPDRLVALAGVLPVLAVFVIVIVGIYGGWANPTEAASIGAAACGVLAVASGGLRVEGLKECLLGTAEMTAMIFLVLLGADVMNAALALSQMPVTLAAWVKDSGFPPYLVMAAILLIYIFLGCVMDALAMILLTIPIFYPIVMALDFGLTPTETSIWFGILALMVVEIGLIHPPVGLNVYIINTLARDVPLSQTFVGVIPFLISDLLRILLLLFVPSVSLVLIRAFGG